MLIGGRLFFLSDYEGTGNIYSCALDGSGLARHTDHDGDVRQEPVDRWAPDRVSRGRGHLDAGRPGRPGPHRIDVSLGSPAAARAPRLVTAADHLGELDCDRTGQASVVEVRGTVHWLTHKDGPARALHVDPEARARLPRVLGETGKVAWVTDAAGPDALEIASVTGEAGTVRLAAGAIGSVVSLAAAPDGTAVAAAANDGRLLAGRDDARAPGGSPSWPRRTTGPYGAVLVAGLGLAGLVPARAPRPLRRIRMARVADP